MELHTKVDCLKCPRCGEMAYLEISFWDSLDEESAGYRPVYQFCFKCGYSGTGNHPIDPEKDASAGYHIPDTLLALFSLNLRNGTAEFCGMLGDTLEGFLSRFTSAPQEPDADPSGSYLN